MSESRMPRILVVQPGSSISTSDVHDGLLAALYARGVQIFKYNLDQRINMSAQWFTFLKRQRNAAIKRDSTVAPFPLYTDADILYHAGQDVLARALRLEVDWVLVVSGMYLSPDVMILLKRAGLKVAVVLTESPYDDEKQAPFIEHADLVWTNERTSVDVLRQANPSVEYLPHAINPGRHNPYGKIGEDIPEHDVLFIGTGFKERIDLLSAVNWDGINLGLYGTWDLLGSRNRLRQHVAGGYVDNRLAAQYYRRSRICLNLYRTSKGFGRHADVIDHAESLNPRALELAACGAFQVSDHRAEVTETFGDLVPTFEDPDDLEQIIRYYLEHEAERKRIAAALPATVSEWTFEQRAEVILSAMA